MYYLHEETKTTETNEYFLQNLLVCFVKYVGADYILLLLKIFKISALPLYSFKYMITISILSLD